MTPTQQLAHEATRTNGKRIVTGYEMNAINLAFRAETAALNARFPLDTVLGRIALWLSMHEPGVNDADTVRRIKAAMDFPELPATRLMADNAASFYGCRNPDQTPASS